MSDLKIFAKTIDDKAKSQIDTLLAQPAFAECKVRIMPDVHAGAGCVIGFTADLGDKVIPNIVGVDIGCGMYTGKIGKFDIDYEKLDRVIKQYVPSGMNVHDHRTIGNFDLHRLYCYDHLKNVEWIENSMGTLGGGNHFIEVDVDDEGTKYLVIHTGSRNLGKQVCDYYQNVAISNIKGKAKLKEETDKLIAEYKASGRSDEIPAGINELKRKNRRVNMIPDDLCYLEGEWRDRYLHDMELCQAFAVRNRSIIATNIFRNMGWLEMIRIEDYEEFSTIHNYIDHESNIVRKGAISAMRGQKLLIPINMRDGSIIGIGKGNEDWNCSAPHGAGRIMSRMEAKRTLNLEDYRNTMDGIFTTSVCTETIDEAPQAYKSMDEILECIKDTVDVVNIIRPVYNFKAAEK